MRPIKDTSLKDSGKNFTFSRDFPTVAASGPGKFDERKGGPIPRDKKYEGYSSLQPKGFAGRERKDGKESKKDKKIDEELIHNLHQHIYYLEMQLKLLKDKDVESKKGGLDALFRDGIPLNEHFLALKNRYKKEKKELEDKIASLEKEIADTSANNTSTARRIEMIGEEYEQTTKQHEENSEFSSGRERDLRGKLFLEARNCAELKAELDKRTKDYNQLRSGNAHILRLREKNKMLSEKKDDKELLECEKRNNDTIEYLKGKVTTAGIDQEKQKKEYDDLILIKEYEDENMNLIKKESALNREITVANGKIAEMENMREMALKSIEEEAALKRKFQKEQELLQSELDKKSKMKEEDLKEYLNEKESSLIMDFQTRMGIDNMEMEYFINLLRDEEERVKSLADEKAHLQEQTMENKDIVTKLYSEKQEEDQEIVELEHKIELAQIDLTKLNRNLESWNRESEQLEIQNESIAKDIESKQGQIEALNQKMQLNEILKEVDFEDLKVLRQNNMTVNSAITGLIAKWESLESK